nr:immunoglobulin light chain junction region [Macaca mulatta]
CQQHNTYPYIF